LVLTSLVMIVLAFGIERIVLRPLVNQEHIILFMATIGLNFFLEGFGEMLWGANVKKLDVGIPDKSFMVAGIQVNQLELSAGVIIGVGEKIGEVYWGPLVGGAIENWFAYVLALAFLLIRPQGLFGERIIERV